MNDNCLAFFIPKERKGSKNIKQKLFLSPIHNIIDHNQIPNPNSIITIGEFLEFLFGLPLNTISITKQCALLPDSSTIHYKEKGINSYILNITLKNMNPNQSMLDTIRQNTFLYNVLQNNQNDYIIIIKSRMEFKEKIINGSMEAISYKEQNLPLKHPYTQVGKYLLKKQESSLSSADILSFSGKVRTVTFLTIFFHQN